MIKNCLKIINKTWNRQEKVVGQLLKYGTSTTSDILQMSPESAIGVAHSYLDLHWKCALVSSMVHLYSVGIIGRLSKLKNKVYQKNYGRVTYNQKMSHKVSHNVAINSSNINKYNKYR